MSRAADLLAKAAERVIKADAKMSKAYDAAHAASRRADAASAAYDTAYAKAVKAAYRACPATDGEDAAAYRARVNRFLQDCIGGVRLANIATSPLAEALFGDLPKFPTIAKSESEVSNG